MVTHFFERTAELVKAPIVDRSGQSVGPCARLSPEKSESGRQAGNDSEQSRRDELSGTDLATAIY